jgi:sugar phosphate isomerase/epimerase
MRLAVSNLAIPRSSGPRDLTYLRSLGVNGIEVAPTRLAPWEELDARILDDYRSMLADAGLVVSSLQALLFGKDEACLLGNEQSFGRMLDHLTAVAEIGARLGASIGVFGAPRNRRRRDMERATAWSLGCERLERLAAAVEPFGFALVLEPVPAAYGGDFLTQAAETLQMVGEVNRPGLRAHLDTGCIKLGGDDIAVAIHGAGEALSHFHIAEPGLSGFDTPLADHEAAASALRQVGYRGWLAIEMLEQAGGLTDVVAAVRFATSCYGDRRG